MGLKLYYKNTEGSYIAISQDDELTYPVFTSHDGKNGDTKTLDLYLRNDESDLWFSNISILPYDLDTSGACGGYESDVTYEDTGWGVKLNKGGTEPISAEWENIEWGEAISMDNVGSDLAANTTTYYPFWYLVTCPPNANAQNKEDIVLKVRYTENAVT